MVCGEKSIVVYDSICMNYLFCERTFCMSSGIASEKTVITEDLKKADQAWINGDHSRALDIYAQWDGILSPLQKKRLDSVKSKEI